MRSRTSNLLAVFAGTLALGGPPCVWDTQWCGGLRFFNEFRGWCVQGEGIEISNEFGQPPPPSQSHFSDRFLPKSCPSSNLDLASDLHFAHPKFNRMHARTLKDSTSALQASHDRHLEVDTSPPVHTCTRQVSVCTRCICVHSL